MNVHEWTSRQNRVYRYHGILMSLKRRKSCHMPTWMKFEATMLSEISQPQKDRILPDSHLYELSKADRFTETESRMVVTWD